MNPLTGRFWTADTCEGENSAPASLHKYLYANADGINVLDPSGLVSVGELNAVASIRSLITQTNIGAGFAAADTLLYGPIAATSGLYVGAAIGASIPAVMPFARAIARPLSALGRIASEAMPGGMVALSRLALQSRSLCLPYNMLREMMELGGLTARGYQANHLLPDAIFINIPRSHGLAVPMLGTVGEQYSQHWRFHRALEVAWDYSFRAKSRFPTVDEFVERILPDALQNAGFDPYAALQLAEACKEQALNFGYSLKDRLPQIVRNTKQ